MRRSVEIVRNSHADSKRIARNAKRMNNGISDAIYKHGRPAS